MVVWQVTIFSIICAVFLFFAYKRGYKRGLFKEFLWADILIIVAFLAGFLFNLVVAIYNTASNLILTRLHAQGLNVNPDTAKWNPDTRVVDAAGRNLNHGREIAEIIIFFVLALVSYAIVSGKSKPLRPGEKPASAKSILGGIISVLSVGFLLATIFRMLMNITNGGVNVTLLQNANFVIPSLTGVSVPFSGADIKVISKTQDLPLLGWDAWVPIIIAVMQFFYILYVTFAKPPTVTRVQLRLGLIFFLAVSTIIVAIFAWQLNLVKIG